MKKFVQFLFGFIFILTLSLSCNMEKQKKEQAKGNTEGQKKLANYAEVQLKVDLSFLTSKQIKLLTHLVKAGDAIDHIYWQQAYGDKTKLLEKISDPYLKKYAMINYGPWDRLEGFAPFTDQFQPRPLGLGFFPKDITREEFFAFRSDMKYDPYTKIIRDPDRSLRVLPYHIAYDKDIRIAVDEMKTAATLTESKDFKKYLLQKAEDLSIDNFGKSDQLWKNLKDNDIDFIIGPIVNTEDHFIWTKYSYGSITLLKDRKWTKKVEKYALLLPFLHKKLPVPDGYKKGIQENDFKISVYDVLFWSGHCNAGNKLISMNYPIGRNAYKIHFKNIMHAKFDQILQPISNLVIDKAQRQYVNFNAFFLNTIFYEIGNAISIEKTINSKLSVKDALKEHYNVITELKNDVLRMYLLNQVHDMRQIENINMKEAYVTYMADVFRSIRFGVTDAQGVANMIRFNYLYENKAFTYNTKSNTYKINDYKMKKAIESLSSTILKIEGDGDFHAADQLIKDKGYIREDLLKDLYRIQRAKIPKDIYFNQVENHLLTH